MKQTQVSVKWERGLHLRPAAQLVKCARSFRSTISLRIGQRVADARSIVAILLLSATMGTPVDLEVSGVDEDQAMAAVTSVFSSEELEIDADNGHGLS